MTQMRASLGHVILTLPGDSVLLESAGKVSLVHGQLELMLRMVFKTLSGLTVQEALDATTDMRTSDIRKHIEKMFSQKCHDIALRCKLKALLGHCKRVSEQRNKLLHNAWAIASDGSIVTKGVNHAWGEAPTPVEINFLAEEISQLVEKLNQERLSGFIFNVSKEDTDCM